MLDTLSHKGNANQKYTMILSHSSKNGYHQENKNKSSKTLMGMLISTATLEISMETPQKTKIRTTM
jgi:hypothetical protein